MLLTSSNRFQPASSHNMAQMTDTSPTPSKWQAYCWWHYAASPAKHFKVHSLKPIKLSGFKERLRVRKNEHGSQRIFSPVPALSEMKVRELTDLEKFHGSFGLNKHWLKRPSLNNHNLHFFFFLYPKHHRHRISSAKRPTHLLDPRTTRGAADRPPRRFDGSARRFSWTSEKPRQKAQGKSVFWKKHQKWGWMWFTKRRAKNTPTKKMFGKRRYTILS